MSTTAPIAHGLLEANKRDVAELATRSAAHAAFRKRAPQRRLESVFDGVSVRIARAGDLDVKRLAALDASPVPAGHALVAMRDGRALAAVPVDGGEAVADPFERTAAIIDVLLENARQLREARAPRRRLAVARRRHLAMVAGA